MFSNLKLFPSINKKARDEIWFRTAQSGDAQELASMLSSESVIHVDHSIQDGKTLLEHACYYMNINTVGALLDRGAKAGGGQENKRNAFHWLVEGCATNPGQVRDRYKAARDILEELLFRGKPQLAGAPKNIASLSITEQALTTTKDPEGFTPLCLALHRNQGPLVLAMLEAGFKVRQINSHNALRLAIRTRDVTLVDAVWKAAEAQRLLSQLINKPDSIAGTCLHEAVNQLMPKTVGALVTSGALVDETDNCKNTPLHLALRMLPNKEQIALPMINSMLNEGKMRSTGWNSNEILQGCPMNVKNSSDETPLTLIVDLAMSPTTETVGKQLLEDISRLGAFRDGRDDLPPAEACNAFGAKGYAAVHAAAKLGQVQVLKTLVGHGADMDLCCQADGSTPARLVAQAGKTRVLMAVLSLRKKPSSVSIFLETPHFSYYLRAEAQGGRCTAIKEGGESGWQLYELTPLDHGLFALKTHHSTYLKMTSTGQLEQHTLPEGQDQNDLDGCPGFDECIFEISNADECVLDTAIPVHIRSNQHGMYLKIDKVEGLGSSKLPYRLTMKVQHGGCLDAPDRVGVMTPTLMSRDRLARFASEDGNEPSVKRKALHHSTSDPGKGITGRPDELLPGPDDDEGWADKMRRGVLDQTFRTFIRVGIEASQAIPLIGGVVAGVCKLSDEILDLMNAASVNNDLIRRLCGRVRSQTVYLRQVKSALRDGSALARVNQDVVNQLATDIPNIGRLFVSIDRTVQDYVRAMKASKTLTVAIAMDFNAKFKAHDDELSGSMDDVERLAGLLRQRKTEIGFAEMQDQLADMQSAFRQIISQASSLHSPGVLSPGLPSAGRAGTWTRGTSARFCANARAVGMDIPEEVLEVLETELGLDVEEESCRLREDTLKGLQIPVEDITRLELSKVRRSARSDVHRCVYGGCTVALQCRRPQAGLPLRTVLEHEVYVLSLLRHPNVIRLHGVVDRDDKLELLLDYHKETLQDVLEEKSSTYRHYDMKARLFLAQQIAEGMAHLNRRVPVVHGNLKPSNVMISFEDGRAVVTDFYVAGLLSSGLQPPAPSPSAAYYVAPEVVAGQAKRLHSSDVFSYGAILYELLTNESFSGCRRTRGSADGAAADPEVHEVVVTFPDRPAVPPALQQLIRECTDVDAEKRPSFWRIVSTLREIKKRPPPA